MIDEVKGNNYYSEPIAFELEDSDIKETIRARTRWAYHRCRPSLWNITPADPDEPDVYPF